MQNKLKGNLALAVWLADLQAAMSISARGGCWEQNTASFQGLTLGFCTYLSLAPLVYRYCLSRPDRGFCQEMPQGSQQGVIMILMQIYRKHSASQHLVLGLSCHECTKTAKGSKVQKIFVTFLALQSSLCHIWPQMFWILGCSRKTHDMIRNVLKKKKERERKKEEKG